MLKAQQLVAGIVQSTSTDSNVNSTNSDQPANLPLMDIKQATANHLGIRVCGLDKNDSRQDQMEVVIPKGTQYPTDQEFTKVKFTAEHNQVQFQISIIEGESPFAEYCEEISQMSVEGIPAAPQGQQSFTIVFRLEPDGSLLVDAFSNAEGGQRAQRLEITAESLRMTAEER